VRQTCVNGLMRHAISRERYQLTTDGLAPYRNAIPNTLEDCTSFAQLFKAQLPPVLQAGIKHRVWDIAEPLS